MSRAPRRTRTGTVAGAALVVTLVVLYAPLVFMVVSSVNANPLSGRWEGLTGRWYRAALSDRAADAFAVSVRLAALAAIGSTITGTLAAVAVRRRRWLRGVQRGSTSLRVATPEIVMATGLGVLLPLIGVRFGFVAMAVAHTAYLSAYVALLVGARAAGADPHMEEAALDLGAGPWRTLVRVVLPDLRPAIVSSALLVAAFSFDDVALSLALRGPSDTTLPLYILSASQRRTTPAIAAVGALVLTIGLASFVGALLANRALLRERGS